MKPPSRVPSISALAAVAAALMALALLPGCGKAAKQGGGGPAKAGSGPGAAGTNSAAGARTNLAAEFVSVFDNSLPPGNKGKDPFNPLSQRVDPHAPSPGRPGPAAPPVDPQLRLLGVVGSPGHWMAAINNQILAVNEGATVRFPGGSVKLNVVEIGSNYAEVMVEGSAVTKRLTLSPAK
jgi:hypothetical protein